jgi:CheY-like chemotaxis protein
MSPPGCCDGRQATQLPFAKASGLSTRNVLKTKPDMLLLDVNMPALPGDRMCAILRSEPELEKLPIYLYSSNDEDILRESAKRFQADGYICKGNIGGLRSKVQQVLL